MNITHSLKTNKTVNFNIEICNYRQQILQQLLENKSGLCISTVADELEISRTAVQQHFRILEHEGLIKKHDQIKTNGRPLTRYVLTDAGIEYFPKNYLGFSELILQSLKNELGSQGLADFLSKVGSQYANNYRQLFIDKPESEQMRLVFELMQDLGYHPNALDNTNKLTDIQAKNCIYHDLVQQFPEICRFDVAFFSTLLADNNDKKVVLHRCMEKGDQLCCFKVEANKKLAS